MVDPAFDIGCDGANCSIKSSYNDPVDARTLVFNIQVTSVKQLSELSKMLYQIFL